MSEWRFAWRSLRRDAKAGELTVFVLALVVAVAAITAVGFFTERIGGAVSHQAAEILAADLVLRSGRPIDTEHLARADTHALETASVINFPSVVLAGESSALAEVKAVSPGYPLRGRLRVSDTLGGTDESTTRVPVAGEAWADARLLARLGLDVGAELQVGRATFPVTRVLSFAPDQGWQFVEFAPTLLINLNSLDSTQLIQPGSRVTYRSLFAGPPEKIEAFREAVTETLQGGERLTGLADTRPEIRRSLERADQFLALSALVSVLLAAVAIAMAAKRYSSRHLDGVALMKCLGALQGFIQRVVLLQLLVLALVASLIGALLGFLAQWGLVSLLGELIDGDLPQPSIQPAFVGLVTAVVLLAGFALPPLMQLRRVPPLRVLRHQLAPPAAAQMAVYGASSLAVGALLWWHVRDLRLIVYILGGAAVTIIALTSVGGLLVWLIGRTRSAGGVAWRYGLANIVRRGRDSVVQVVAFGLGIMVLLLLSIVRGELLENWRSGFVEQAPNHFMINIQPDERDRVRDFFEQRALPTPTLIPLVRARLTHLNDVAVRDIEFASARGRRFAQREANLSWAADLKQDNELVAGSWWGDKIPDNAEVSIEVEFAESLGIGLGDRLRFDVAGEAISAQVSSLRRVEWDSFEPNFFVVFSPGALEQYPATFISSLRLEEDQRTLLFELVRVFPSITTIDMDSVLKQVRGVMDKAALAVESVFAFTLMAGLVVLLGTVQATRDERRYESAMLRTLGASRRVVFQGVASEFLALGTVAGVLAAMGASAAGYLLARNVFELVYTPSPLLWLTGLLAGTLFIGVSGMLLVRPVINHPPLSTLREN